MDPWENYTITTEITGDYVNEEIVITTMETIIVSIKTQRPPMTLSEYREEKIRNKKKEEKIRNKKTEEKIRNKKTEEKINKKTEKINKKTEKINKKTEEKTSKKNKKTEEKTSKKNKKKNSTKNNKKKNSSWTTVDNRKPVKKSSPRSRSNNRSPRSRSNNRSPRSRSNNRSPRSREFINTTLILKNLSYNETYSEELMQTFEKCGTIKFINVIRNDDESCKGIAFIRFETKAGSDNGLQMDGYEDYTGRNIRVQYARDRREKK